MADSITLARFVEEEADAPCEPAFGILGAACLDPDAVDFDEQTDVVLRDGSAVEMMAEGIASGGRFRGAGFTVRSGGVGPLLARLIFDLALAGDFIINPGGIEGNEINPMILLTDEAQRPHVIGDWGETAVLCRSWDQLSVALDHGFDRWERWTHGTSGGADDASGGAPGDPEPATDD